MSEDNKPKVTLIKQSKTVSPAPIKEAAVPVQPEKKVVVVRKKIVTVKPKIKVDEKKEEEKPVSSAPSPAEAKPAPVASKPVAQAPVKRESDKPVNRVIRPTLPRAGAPRHDSFVPEANRNLIGGERLSSTLHNGPVVIKPNNLPPVPGQANQGSSAPAGGPRVAGVVGGRPTQRPQRPMRPRTGMQGDRPFYNNRDGQQGGMRGPGQNGGRFVKNGTGAFIPRNNNGRPPFNKPGFKPAGGFNRGPASPSDPVAELNQKGAQRKSAGKHKDEQTYRKERDQEIDFQLQQKKKENSKLSSVPKSIDIMENITVSDLAKKMNLKASDIITKLFKLGMMVTINQQIDHETAEIIASEYGCEVHLVNLYDETIIETEEDVDDEMVPRAPIVTIMGHVDHGKTKLLDAIRSSNVAGGEFGGITQHIGAYKVAVPGKGNVVFLDTPGHAAFSMMRARGAQVTDIVVLVVAANDGVMPQTREAIDHAKAAKVPIIVAINKCDLPEANPERVMQQLSDLGLMPEEWGGTTLYCQISALKKQGIDDLLDTILLQAEMLELRANPNCRAVGKVLESRIDQGRGTVATVLIEKGTLHQGDYYVAGIYPGRVRAMFDDKGKKIKTAGPSDPVEIIGLSNIPSAGDPFQVTEDEKQARSVGAKRQELERLNEGGGNNKFTLENMYQKIKEGELKDFNVVIKGDVQGSVEALQATLEKLSNAEIHLNVLRSSAGAIIESDVTLAAASQAMIIGFNVRPTPRAQALAEQEKVEIKKYNVIYDVVDDVTAAMEGMLSPEIKEVDIGKVEVRETFRVPKVGLIAGCYVLSGKVKRNSLVRVIRDNIQINKDMIKLSSLKRFKDDAKEVAMGYECGIGLENFQDLQVGDILEIVETEQVARKLEAVQV
jgi:translation initiation factor IF-2